MVGPDRTDLEQPPPLLGTWRNLYVVLVVELAAIVAAGWVLGWWAS